MSWDLKWNGHTTQEVTLEIQFLFINLFDIKIYIDLLKQTDQWFIGDLLCPFYKM